MQVAAEFYLSLAPPQRKDLTAVRPALTDLTDQVSLVSVTPELRRKLVSRLLDDLTRQSWDESATCAALSALKLLGRVVEGSEQLATTEGLSTLLAKGAREADANRPIPDSALEALRCLCNVMLLVEPARERFEGIPGAVTTMVSLLSDPAPLSAQFLAGRALFLLTVKGGTVNRILVEELNITERLVRTFPSALDRSGTDRTSESVSVLCEALKLLFNLASFYPRLAAFDADAQRPPATLSQDQSRASPSLASSPQLTPAAGKRKTPSIKGFLTRTLSGSGSRSGSPDPSTLPPAPRPDPNAPNILSSRGFEDIAPRLVELCLVLPAHFFSADGLPTPPLSHALHALAEFPVSPLWLSMDAAPNSQFLHHTLPVTSPADPSGSLLEPLPPLVARLLKLLEVATNRYSSPRAGDGPHNSPHEQDDVDARLASLLLLLRKCIVGDPSGGLARSLRARLLADDIDRSQPLDRRKDFTGSLLRLMSAVHLPNSKIGASEVIFALCGQDPATMSRTIGWGLAAGFLTSNGLAQGPPKESGVERQDIDPVTGAVFNGAEPAGASMSDEEKEREAERLMVLFERLGKTGVINVENPMRRAQQEGRFQEIDRLDATA